MDDLIDDLKQALELLASVERHLQNQRPTTAVKSCMKLREHLSVMIVHAEGGNIEDPN